MVWNTFGPIERGVRYAYPSWHGSTVAMMANWGTILFILFVGPICWILDRKGLRFTTLLSCALMTLGTISRVFTKSNARVFTYTAHFCSIVNGITGIIVMAAPAALSAAWFPINERTTATSISQTLNVAGNGISFLIGPYIVPDKFLNKTGETDGSEETPLTNLTETVPSREDERELVWAYMVGMAVISVAIFIAMVIYFPSKPEMPPTASASSDAQRLHFKDSIRALVYDRSVMLCFIAFSICTGVQGAWSGVLTLNFDPLKVGDKQSGYIGVSTTAASIVVGVAVGQVTDRIRRHIKWTLILILLLATGSYIWLTLIVLKAIPFSLAQLYMSTISGGATITALMPLFFEYTVEMAYPVPEGIVGGLLTGGNNVVSI